MGCRYSFRLFLVLPPLAQLTLKQLTLKLVTLIAIITTQRCQTLASLDLNLMQSIKSKLSFTLPDKLKTTRPGTHLRPIEIIVFPPEPGLCPVLHINHYITLTKQQRRSSKLFISYIKPFNQVTPETIGRWIKTSLKDAGIDVDRFSAHSSRTASSSYGLASGLNIQDILKAGGWSRAQTFAKHCDKPINPNFGYHILQAFSNAS